eukprot:10156.XXX_222344_223334_1 [CDS] Oithona nana genome sequencing.
MAEAEADINLELKLPCLIGITAEEGATLSALLLSNSSLKKKLKKSDGKLLSALLLWSPTKTSRRTRMPKNDDVGVAAAAAASAVVAKVRAHYSLEQEQEQREEGSIRRSWDDEEVEERKDELAEDRLTRAISDALFVYPFYRMLKTAGDSTPNRVFAYKYSHRGEVSLTQIISTASNARSPKKTSSSSSHFDEVLIQFENKLFGQHHQLNEVDERMARFLWSTWAKFAASDKGNDATSTPGWPQYTHQGGDYYLELRLPTPPSSSASRSSGRRDNRLFHPADMLFWDRLWLRHRPRCSAAL